MTSKNEERFSRITHFIDHTLLNPDATTNEFLTLTEEARIWKFKSVCVNGSAVKHVCKVLKGSGVLVAAVCGFPLGATSTASKCFEAEQVYNDGADELDVVINIGDVKIGRMGESYWRIKSGSGG